MLQMPYADPTRCVDDAVQTVVHAAHAGAVHVAIIPTRSETAAMHALVASGDFVAPRLDQLETALHESLTQVQTLDLPCVVTADTWDIERVKHCAACQTLRVQNIQAMNFTQKPQTVSRCAECEGSQWIRANRLVF